MARKSKSELERMMGIVDAMPLEPAFMVVECLRVQLQLRAAQAVPLSATPPTPAKAKVPHRRRKALPPQATTDAG